MRVIISSGGRFHCFRLAEQLEKNNIDYHLYTTYFDGKENVKKNRVTSFPLLAYLDFLVGRFPLIPKSSWHYLKDSRFDSWVSKNVQNIDVFHGFASFSNATFKNLGEKSVKFLDRASAHIEIQQRILAEEYKKLGLKFVPDPKPHVKRQISEYKLADKILVSSDFVKESFLSKGIDKNKLKVVPFGVSIEKFKPLEKENENLKFKILFVGNISVQKGVHYLLGAVSQLRIPVELALVGSVFPEMKPFLKKYKGFYKYYGKKTGDDLVEMYQKSDVFVLPSLQDGFAMVVLESMACGTPVIVSENTGAPIDEGKTGFRVPIRNVEEIKNKLLYLYENEKVRKKMGEKAEKYAAQFTWDLYGKNIVKLYERCNEK